MKYLKKQISGIKLENSSEIAVIGNGPAGSFFTYFFLDLAERIGLDVKVDVFEQQDFSRYGPAGCNHCGGIVSESLTQILSAEGIIIPSEVLQRGIQSYTLHMDIGSVNIDTPLDEQRIAAVYRGAGPLGTKEHKWSSFDGYLQKLINNKGAHLIKDFVESINWNMERPHITTRNGLSKSYDLIVGAVGLRASSLQLFEEAGFGYRLPRTTKTYICEFKIGYELMQKYFGSSMHVFLLNIPRLEFAALIPKGDFVTMVLLGKKIDKELVNSFVNSPEVKRCFPPNWKASENTPCQCYPRININTAIHPYADRVVLVGDSATSKLYKNGIGAAYITAKSAATTALFHGVSESDFKKHYWPVCRSINYDNSIGKIIFTFTRLIQKIIFSRRGIQRMIIKEHSKNNSARRLSMVLWDTFTGSATYKNIFLRFINPLLVVPLIYETIAGLFFKPSNLKMKNGAGKPGMLGKKYSDGESIFKQGELGDCMYVIQSGKVEVVQEKEGKEIHLAVLGENNYFGEMSIFEGEVRSATIRAKGDTYVLTVDKKAFFERIQKDPSLAFRIVEKMSLRIRELNTQVSRIKSADRRDWDTRTDNRD